LLGGNCELFNIGAEIEKEKILLEADAIVLLFPSYAYGAPPVVRRFVKKAEFRSPYVVALVSFGTKAGGALAEIYRILKTKNIGSLYFGRIPAVENYIAIFGSPSEAVREKRGAMQEAATQKAADHIARRETNRINAFRPFSALISLLFSQGIKLFYKWYRIGNTCNGCGICAALCPVSAIVMRNRRPMFTGKCEHCQGCLNWCPQRAIGFARLREHTPRYHHPGISAAEMMR
jgi:ferredoxin